MSAAPPRRIWLCADDYGISDGVNRAICDLIARRRLNATSVMMVGPAIGAREVAALREAVQANGDCAIGLHVVLTALFHPLTMHFRPLHGGLFPPLAAMLRKALLRQIDAETIRAEVTAQIAAFTSAFGRPPDYLDGHQHVQLFPQVRDGVIAAMTQSAPGAWLRQCGDPAPAAALLRNPKALLLNALSAGLRRRAAKAGIQTNAAFAGAYDFTRPSAFGALLRSFIRRMPENGLVMCHPGIVDDTLRSLDPLTDQREREYDYLGSDACAAMMTEEQVSLERPRAMPSGEGVLSHTKI